MSMRVRRVQYKDNHMNSSYPHSEKRDVQSAYPRHESIVRWKWPNCTVAKIWRSRLFFVISI